MSTESNSQVYIFGSFVALGGVLFGYQTTVFSGVSTMSNFTSKFGDVEINGRKVLTSLGNTGIVITLSSGCFLGSLMAGKLSDRWSRKHSICLSSLIFIISVILEVFSINYTMLIFARFIAGMY